jgi:hypothetical protein
MLLANDEQHAHLDFKVIKNILHKLKILYTKFTCQEIGTIAWPLSAWMPILCNPTHLVCQRFGQVPQDVTKPFSNKWRYFA